MQVGGSIAAATATAQALAQVHHLERFTELVGERGRKQQPPPLHCASTAQTATSLEDMRRALDGGDRSI